MRYFAFLLILVLGNGCSLNKSSDKEIVQYVDRIVYVNNPRPTDSLCISEIQHAKTDVQSGKIVFTQSAGFLFGSMRYEEELRQLCKENGLEFDFDLIGCVVFEGQTQGCYGSYMDEVIFSRFGLKFKETLHRQADSLFLVNVNSQNKIVEYWDCDERPRLPDEIKRTHDYMPDLVVSDIDIKNNKGEWPFFDLGFIIEKDSTLSGFHIRNFVAELKENEKYRDQMFSRAVEHIKSNYSLWVPGTIKGEPVRTDNNVRIFIKRK